jgi:hypothetical protein
MDSLEEDEIYERETSHEDIYTAEGLDRALEDDAIEDYEEAFMKGYRTAI